MVVCARSQLPEGTPPPKAPHGSACVFLYRSSSTSADRAGHMVQPQGHLPDTPIMNRPGACVVVALCVAWFP